MHASRRIRPIPRRRFYRPVQAPVGPRTNERIRITPIRLVDEDGEMVGVVETEEARQRARDLGLDLVEIAADVRPPVCRIMDFGKFKYEKSKKDRANKTKATELKEVRLGRSMKIDPHDIQIRLKQARKFLLEGHKVQIVQNFRGREMAHRDRGDQRMKEIVKELDDIAKVELFPRMNGRRMTMVLAPDKPKVQQYLRKHGADGVATSTATKAAEKPVEEPPAEEPSAEAAVEPTIEPTVESTVEPTIEPTEEMEPKK